MVGQHMSINISSYYIIISYHNIILNIIISYIIHSHILISSYPTYKCFPKFSLQIGDWGQGICWIILAIWHILVQALAKVDPNQDDDSVDWKNDHIVEAFSRPSAVRFMTSVSTCGCIWFFKMSILKIASPQRFYINFPANLLSPFTYGIVLKPPTKLGNTFWYMHFKQLVNVTHNDTVSILSTKHIDPSRSSGAQSWRLLSHVTITTC